MAVPWTGVQGTKLKGAVLNARDIVGRDPHKILVVAPVGHGKTSQFLTLPGRKFAYLFDPNARLTLRGFDVEFEEFLPDKVNLSAGSLSKSGSKDKVTSYQSDLYVKWNRDFDEKMEGGFFEQFDWLAMDSCTTLLDLIMDRVLTLNGRYGQYPHEDDWGPQMIAFKNVVRAWTGLNKGIYFTAHLDTRQDQMTKKVWEDPMMTGRLRTQIPLLFSDIFSLEMGQDKEGNPAYLMRTLNEKQQRFHRTSIRGLSQLEDVTIDWKQPAEGQGLGGIINWWERQQKVA